MKKGYWFVAYRSISDESAVKAYGALALPALEAFGGRVLTGSTSQIQAHEASLSLRTILVEFDSYETALAARASAATRRLSRRWVRAQNATFALSRVREEQAAKHASHEARDLRRSLDARAHDLQ